MNELTLALVYFPESTPRFLQFNDQNICFSPELPRLENKAFTNKRKSILDFIHDQTNHLVYSWSNVIKTPLDENKNSTNNNTNSDTRSATHDKLINNTKDLKKYLPIKKINFMCLFKLFHAIISEK